MAEFKVQLSGWWAIVGCLVLVGVVVFRFMTVSDLRDDQELMLQVETLLMNEYAPHVLEKMRSAVDAGDEATIEKTAEVVLGTEVMVQSVEASYPLLKFSLPKEVVVKVVFSLDSSDRSGEKKIIY